MTNTEKLEAELKSLKIKMKDDISPEERYMTIEAIRKKEVELEQSKVTPTLKATKNPPIKGLNDIPVNQYGAITQL